jgi:hypothetical protein
VTKGESMKRLATLVASLIVVVSPAVFAHGGNDHVRGVITQVSPQSVTVQTTGKTTKTLTLTAKTTFDQGGKPAHLSDLKVGDRVVIDVPEHSTEAILIRVAAPKASTARTSPSPKKPASSVK